MSKGVRLIHNNINTTNNTTNNIRRIDSLIVQLITLGGVWQASISPKPVAS